MAAPVVKFAEAPIKRIMMCRPAHFQLSYSINPWMDMRRGVNKERANTQWNQLKDVLQQAGAKVEVMEPQVTPVVSSNPTNHALHTPAGSENLPDMVFTANAAVLKGKKAYLANFFFNERKGERAHYDAFLKSLGYQTAGSEEIPFEGAGDALWGGPGMSRLFVGIGPRSDGRVLPILHKHFEKENATVIGCNLIDPRFYHIDTCFCPLNEEVAIWFPHAFDSVAQFHIKTNTNVIDVDDKEAKNFACNAVVIGRTVIMHKDSPRIAQTLHRLGYEVAQLDMSEFIKSGGSAKCCTLAL